MDIDNLYNVWTQKLSYLKGAKIGLNWQRNLNNPIDYKRSIPLSYFENFFEKEIKKIEKPDWSKCDDYMKPLLCYDKNNKVIPESERKIIDSQIDEQNEKNKIGPMPITVIYYDEIRFGKTKEKVVGNLSPLQWKNF